MILFVLPLEVWKRPPRPRGRPHITWLKTVQNDLKSYNLTLTKAVDMAQNRSLWRLLTAFHADTLVVQANKDDDDDDVCMFH